MKCAWHDKMPNVPQLELELTAHYVIAKVKGSPNGGNRTIMHFRG